MEDNNKLLNEVAEISIRLQEIYDGKRIGFISCDLDRGIHLIENEFLKYFKEYHTRERNDDTYKEELYTYHNGVKFFCIK